MTLSFKEFSVDSAALELHVGEHAVAIDERHILLLRLLAEHFPEHCSKQQCLAYIWPDTVVSDMSLSKLVSDTRKIFVNAGYDGRLIQTVHGRGYRLEHVLGKQIAAQQEAQTAAQAQQLAAEHQSRESSTFGPAQTVTQTEQVFSQNEQASKQSHHSASITTEQSLVDSDSNQQTLDTQQGKQSQVAAPLVNWWEIFAKVLIAVLLVLGLLFQFWRGGFNTEPSKQLAYSEPNGAIGRILWVDDNPQNNLVEKAYFEQKNIGVYNTVTSEEALMLLSMYNYQAVISDMGRHGDSLAGLKLLQAIRANGHKTPFYLYTYVESAGVIDAIQESGGQAVVVDSESLYLKVLTHFEVE
ncbi:winged helix-turn-helix domain-containing protein [Shewanella sp. 1CM18E]|uniref:winged helix-turn-helix domain-containing protein n=1 Tax=Shewanella sp. 1CM18E TaxID=2929169 RepID=UPI0020BE7E47|nr:winged helix-turn-helix domain-containing protein [Shewanella sp. 1CM18E]MCK8044830.1 winged helix-turn-helix domain-containing protein [Shewanella sp. 1CM18E]